MPSTKTKTYSRKPPKRVLDDSDNEVNEEDLIARKRQRDLTASHPPSSSSSSTVLSSDAPALWSSDAPNGENISPPSSPLPSSEPMSCGKSANEATIATTILVATESLIRQRPAPPPPPSPPVKRTLRVHRRRNSPPPMSRSVLRTVIDTNANAGTRSRRNKVSSRPRPTRLTQLQIDLGGEVRKTCSGCGMDYIPSNVEDAGLHKTFHARHLDGIQLGSGSTTTRRNQPHLPRNHSARGPILDVEPSRRPKDLEQDDEDMGTDYVILVVDRRSSAAEKAKAIMALDIVNADLSASDIDEARLWGKVSSMSSSLLRAATAASNMAPDKTDKYHQTDRFKVYLYLYKGRCIGLCLAEHITRGYRVIATSDHRSIITNNVDDHELSSHGRRRQRQRGKEENHSWSSSISIDRDQAHEAILGVSRIWTSRAYRRRGIATRLLECARRSFVYGLVIAKDRVAFSQPSQSGKALAEAWFGVDGGGHQNGTDWLVYVDG